ncbi:FAD-dependent oxidoreductase [Candidatus Pacearchaeota archaeon]|nr:FAD-dependent oxidoreductase [Candidatus Pacearchaeota archaeon]
MKRVVIIGGGFAGSTIARQLEGIFSVTLIDTKDYFEFTPGILRTLVEPDHAKHVQVLHRKYLKYAKFILGEVTNVTHASVWVEKQKIPYDYLVICAGSTYALPIKESNLVMATRGHHLHAAHTRLQKAQRILVIGGGLVGVELAAEIAEHYPQKEITLMHSHSRLMPRNAERAARYAEIFLRAYGVSLSFNERFSKSKNKRYYTDTGRVFTPDLAFLCTGIIPNGRFLHTHFRSSLNRQNQVKVNSFLQVKGHERIFAAGDITDIGEEKTAQNAEHQAHIIVRNICALENRDSLRRYQPRTIPIVISLGKWHGILEYGRLVITGMLPAFFKWAIERREMLKLRAW